jgi:hypothetical protein
MLARLGPPTKIAVESTTALGDWHATALFWRPQVMLAVNDITRLPVLVPLAPARTVVDRFGNNVAAVLTALDIDPAVIERERSAMRSHQIATTADRSVVGSLNEAAFFADVHRDDHPMSDGWLIVLSLRLAGIPCGPLRKSTSFPDLETQKVLAADR